jgi:biotin synthase-related radical SAM superfamily protein
MTRQVIEFKNAPANGKLYEELLIKADVSIDGVNIDSSAREALKSQNHQEQVHGGFEMDLETHVGDEMPSGFYLPLGLKTAFRYSSRSRYSISFSNDEFILSHNNRELFPVRFFEQPKYYSLISDDGIPLKNIASFAMDSNISVFYSNECNYKEKGEDCLFCNANATKETYGDHEGIQWKTPHQAAEAVDAAYREGVADHVTITGGIIAERREIEYYQDVAEAIQNRTGRIDFNGTAVIAAPLDLSHIDKLKEVGYRTIAMNIELWDKNIYQTICPGKARNSGGWEHWLKAIEYAVGVFGFGRVRSNIVAGIEPKLKTLEGVKHFSEIGVVCLPGPWCPNPGSALEGHRTPEPSWHLDLAYKAVNLQRSAGITYEQVHDASNNDLAIARDIWKIEEGKFL